MQFTSIIAASIISFVAAAPAPVDWKTVDYSGVDYSKVDWNTVDYSGVDWKTVDYSGVNWNTVNYGGKATATPAPAAPSTTLTTSATATAAPSASSVPSGPYGFTSFHSGDINVHLQPIYANGTLRLGGTPPQSYTPAGVNVPQTSQLGINVAYNTAGLAVAVPGGQQLFVKSDGTIGYTQPHSANTGSGSVTTGFSLKSGRAPSLLFNNKEQFLACPVTGAAGVYEVTVAEKTSRQDCTGVSLTGTLLKDYAGAFEWN